MYCSKCKERLELDIPLLTDNDGWTLPYDEQLCMHCRPNGFFTKYFDDDDKENCE